MPPLCSVPCVMCPLCLLSLGSLTKRERGGIASQPPPASLETQRGGERERSNGMRQDGVRYQAGLWCSVWQGCDDGKIEGCRVRQAAKAERSVWPEWM